MRLFSWSGVSALACAATGGFLAGEAVHRHDAAVIQVCDAGGELCDVPPTKLSPPQLIEEIDLTCPPTLAEAFGPQSMEPPLADGPPDAIRTVNFELPAGPPIDAEALPFMPYLTDDGAPGPLPPLGDVPLLNPPTPVTPSTPDPSDPIYHAVKRFVDNAAKLPELPRSEAQRKGVLENQTENERQIAAEWHRIRWEDPPSTMVPVHIATDKVPLGKPPVSEHPSAVTPEKPATPPAPTSNTTEIRPGDLPPKPNGDVD
jgi:hypothetical protein